MSLEERPVVRIGEAGFGERAREMGCLWRFREVGR